MPDGFADELIPAPMRPAVHELLTLFLDHGTRWDLLEPPLRAELHDFDARTFAVAFARVQGGNPGAIARKQDYLVRTAVGSILLAVEPLEEPLLALIEQRGLPSLFHHVVRELAGMPGARGAVLNAAERCRIATFALEDVLLETREEPATAATLLKRRDLITRHLVEHLEVKALPFEAAGLALLWVTACIGLGDRSTDNPTQNY